MMKINTFAKGLLFLLGTSFAVNAAVSPDRTRIILNQSDKSVSVRLTNQSTTIPFLAQSWIEDKDNKNPETILLLFRQWCAWRRVSKYRYA